MSELKPCPFCGGKADLVDYGLTGKRKAVQCSDCGARTRSFDPKVKRGENAIDAWNSRVYDDDCVSRQAAIDAFLVRLRPIFVTNQNFIESDAMKFVREVLESLPSAQSEWEELLVICDNCGHAIHVKRYYAENRVAMEEKE